MSNVTLNSFLEDAILGGAGYVKQLMTPPRYPLAWYRTAEWVVYFDLFLKWLGAPRPRLWGIVVGFFRLQKCRVELSWMPKRQRVVCIGAAGIAGMFMGVLKRFAGVPIPKDFNADKLVKGEG